MRRSRKRAVRLNGQRKAWYMFLTGLYSRRGAALEGLHIPPLWTLPFSCLWLSSCADLALPHLEARDTLLKTMGAKTVRSPLPSGPRNRLLTASSASIIRILFMIPIYATVSFLSYLYYRHAIYFEVLRDCYEAFAIASFFTLLCHYLEPTLHEQKNYFRQLRPRNWVLPLNWFQKCTGGTEKGIWRIPRSGLTWFNVSRDHRY